MTDAQKSGIARPRDTSDSQDACPNPKTQRTDSAPSRKERRKAHKSARAAKRDRVLHHVVSLEPPRLTYTAMRAAPVGEYVFIADAASARDAVRCIDAWKTIAVDCEGERLGRAGTLSLVQVATPDNHVYLFDMHDATLRETVLEAGLRRVLESRKITKYMHDCRGDSDALWHIAHTRLCGVLDTQIGHAIVTRINTGHVPLPTGLSTLLKFVFPHRLHDDASSDGDNGDSNAQHVLKV